MNTIVAKKLMIAETSIYYQGVEYEKIKSLVFEKTEKGVVACAELLDKNSNSIRKVFLKDIETENNIENKNIDIDEVYFEGLRSQFKTNALLCINSLGIDKFEKALEYIRNITSIVNDLEEILQQKVESKKEE